jgi:hypothetical protein
MEVLKRRKLLDLFEVATPDQLLNGTFLLPGEVSQLFNAIQELSGFGADAVTEVKTNQDGWPGGNDVLLLDPAWHQAIRPFPHAFGGTGDDPCLLRA